MCAFDPAMEPSRTAPKCHYPVAGARRPATFCTHAEKSRTSHQIYGVWAHLV
jgi:hypothetical protein